MRRSPWRRERLPAPVFLPGESHGQRSLAGYSPRDLKEADTTELLTLALFTSGVLTRRLICWSLRLGLPAQTCKRETSVVHNPPDLWGFCYNSPKGRRQLLYPLQVIEIPSPPTWCEDRGGWLLPWKPRWNGGPEGEAGERTAGASETETSRALQTTWDSSPAYPHRGRTQGMKAQCRPSGSGPSLLIQWLRICPTVKGTRVRSLIWEDPMCYGATKPGSHNS